MNIFKILRGREIASLLILIAFLSCQDQRTEEDPWKHLLNGKDLQGWDTYLGPKYNPEEEEMNGLVFGLNNDPENVFSIVEEDGETALRISGSNFGGISTKKEFENFHLRLEFKWGELKWAPRKNKIRDSGILYFAVGPHGADYGFWMRSQEFQIEEGDCGDYWGVAGGVFDIRSSKNADDQFVYDENGEIRTFSGTSENGRRCIKNPDAEHKSGEWNTIDLYCFNGTSVHVVNGVVNMILTNSRQLDNGVETPLTKGKIQIQSEGAEVYYRNIKIRSIDKIPSDILE